MKQIVIAMVLSACCTTTHAQVASGKVTYEESMGIPINDELPEEAAMVRQLFANGLHFTRELTFNQKASVYKAEKKEERRESGSAEDGMQMQIRFSTPEEITYTDLATGAFVEQRDLMGRKFLVSGEAQKRSWRMTGKQKTVLSYPCQQAISYGPKDTIEAWFTTAIPVSAGPQDWRGLPGLILEGSRVQTSGSYSVKATKVEAGTALAIAPPKEGKKVSRAEFDAIQKEKEKEMMQEFGGSGGGRTIIRMER
jgi:GLPGLI family protein